VHTVSVHPAAGSQALMDYAGERDSYLRYPTLSIRRVCIAVGERKILLKILLKDNINIVQINGLILSETT